MNKTKFSDTMIVACRYICCVQFHYSYYTHMPALQVVKLTSEVKLLTYKEENLVDVESGVDLQWEL